MNKFSLKQLLLGKPVKNTDIAHEKLSRVWGLPIMASDAVSSVAYAIEEILLVMVAAGPLAFRYVPWIALPILLLLVILVFSYSQIIDHYPNGGGAYAVAKENIGTGASLLAASALIIGYILTVAVSISSSTAALASAFPALEPHRVGISLLCAAFITLVNLRGVREASKVFGLPTYIFIFSMAILIIVGFFRLATGSLHPIAYPSVPPVQSLSQAVMIYLLLRAFSSGCSAMSGVEAVSNAVPSFREPAQRNAKHVLYMLGGVTVFIFGGASLLAYRLHVLPVAGRTVLSQMSSAVFGNTFMYYVIQIFTSLILMLAANTAYNGLPQLLYLLAHDGYVPRQFSTRGAKLSFSNGILFIFVVASLLIIGFQSDTHLLIPLYSVGVFVSFTIAQYSMFKKWRSLKEKGWRYKCWINGFGAMVTLVVSVIVFVTKFAEGAWIIGIAIPLLILTMLAIRRHYSFVQQQLRVDNFQLYEKNRLTSTQCILLVHDINKPLLKSINYAHSISNNIVAVHICRHPEHGAALRRQWEEHHIPVPLEVIETPYNDIMQPLETYLTKRESALQHGESISVIVIKFVTEHWYDALLHNQTTYFLERNLSKHRNLTTIILPFHYKK